MLMLLSLCMLVGCYIAGSIPLTVSLSEVSICDLCQCVYSVFMGLGRLCLLNAPVAMRQPAWSECPTHYYSQTYDMYNIIKLCILVYYTKTIRVLLHNCYFLAIFIDVVHCLTSANFV